MKNRTLFRMFVLAVGNLAALITSTSASAQDVTMQLEYGKVQSIGSDLKITRVPITQTDGRVQYWDLNLVFDTRATGKPFVLSADAVRSPRFLSFDFIPGLYRVANDDANWDVLEGSQIGGARGSFAINYTDGSSARRSFQFATGPLAGHPHESTLSACNFSQLEAQGYSFGRVGNGGNGVPDFSTSFGHAIVLLQQNSNAILIDIYDVDYDSTGMAARCSAAPVSSYVLNRVTTAN